MADTQKLQLFTIPFSAVGILFNALLLVFALRQKVASRSATVLLRSQAAFDMLVLVSNLVFVQLQLVPQPASHGSITVGWFVFCIIGNESTVFVWFLINCSIYNTLAFSIERCLCICCNFWWQRHKQTVLKLFFLSIALCNFIAYIPLNLLSIWPNLLPVDEVDVAAIDNETAVNDATHMVVCDNRGNVPQALLRALSVFSSTVTIFIPTICMLVCYAAILLHLRRSAKAMSNPAVSSSKSDAASKRFTVIVGLTVVAFIACNMPDCVNYTAWNLGVSFDDLPLVVRIFLFPFMSAINSLVNPLIYLAFHRQFTSFVFCRGCNGGETSQLSGSATGGVSGSSRFSRYAGGDTTGRAAGKATSAM